MDSTQVFLSVIGGLVAGMWWSVKTWVTRLMKKLDAMDERQIKTEKDCVTWPELEKVTLKVNEHDRRITIIETSCKAEHGK